MHARAFTLIEILIAMTIGAVVFVGIWAMLGIYTRFLDQGQQHADRLQLVRALHQQLTDDLQSVSWIGVVLDRPILPLPALLAAGSPESELSDNQGMDVNRRTNVADDSLGSSVGLTDDQRPARGAPQSRPQQAARSPKEPLDLSRTKGNAEPAARIADDRADGPLSAPPDSDWRPETVIVGLQGNENSIALDVIGFGDDATHQDHGDEAERPSVTPSVPVYRVIYTFVTAEAARRFGRPAGLVRRGISWQRWQTIQQRSTSSLQNTSRPSASAYERMDLASPLADAASHVVVDESQDRHFPEDLDSAPRSNRQSDELSQAADMYDHLPEVSDFRVSYFDGMHWHGQWNSRERHGLPVAVEIRFALTIGSDDPQPTEELPNGRNTERSNDPQRDLATQENVRRDEGNDKGETAIGAEGERDREEADLERRDSTGVSSADGESIDPRVFQDRLLVFLRSSERKKSLDHDGVSRVDEPW